MVMISIRVSVLSFSHEAVKSMFHTQMRWVSLCKHPCSSDPSPSLVWFAGAAISRDFLAALRLWCPPASPESRLCWVLYFKCIYRNHFVPHPPTPCCAFAFLCFFSSPSFTPYFSHSRNPKAWRSLLVHITLAKPTLSLKVLPIIKWGLLMLLTY